MRNSDRSANGSASPVQSVDRAMAILDLLAKQGDTGVTEIAAALGVHKSTAFRLVSALEEWRVVEQVGERGKYRLGFGIIRLAGATTSRLDLPRESREVCERLAEELEETINLALLDLGQATNILQVHGPATITVRNWIGQRTPLHATSSGKVLLAWSTEEQRKLADTLERFTGKTITDRSTLMTELGDIRERGWASTTEELEIGLNAVGAPVRNAGGHVIGAITVSGPAYRLAASSYPRVAERLVAGADEISSRIGYFGRG